MIIRRLIGLFLLGFFTQIAFSNPLFYPHFASKPSFFPQNTRIIPLCQGPLNGYCINQWTQQAIPLGVHRLANPPQMQYHLPFFIPSPLERLIEDFHEEEWDILPSFSDENRSFFRNRSNSNRIRIKEKNKIKEGKVYFVPEDKVKKDPSKKGSFVLKEETFVFPTTTKKLKKGCFIVDQSETEADFCFECGKNNKSSFSQWPKQLLSAIREKLDGVDKSANKKVEGKLGGRRRDGFSQLITKVCSPEISLGVIIANFNSTCPKPYNNFEDFFNKAYCESCSKGIPPEVMMAMMSIESVGICGAKADNEFEKSFGLFQVNSDKHQCRDSYKTYKVKTEENRQCLKDPMNNLNKSIDILSDYYRQVNPKEAISKTKPCPSWLTLTNSKRDQWRKTVSAYNGGPKWVKRAIKSARNTRNSTSWEMLRAHYFIEKLDPKNSRGRELKFTHLNLAHTEAVLGRKNKGRASMVDIWAQYRMNFLKKRRNKIQCLR